jgi:enoyl-CoA hydratase
MSTVLVSEPQPGVTQLGLNRPEKLNAMNSELIEELHAALDEVARDRHCRAVVLTGAGRGFCAGLDLSGYGTVPAPRSSTPCVRDSRRRPASPP